MTFNHIAMSKALVVLSGGQDSVTCLFFAVREFGAENVSALTFDYGQRHDIEIDAAITVARIAGIQDRHEILPLGFGVLAGTSPLTNQKEPLEQYSGFEDMSKKIGDRVEKTFVPMRNALFLTLAANRAVCAGATHIVTGVCEQDGANYPDCRESFIDRQEDAINEGLGLNAKNMIRIQTPLMELSKSDTVELALDLPGTMLALSYSHTAYDGKYPPVGKDHASLLRAQGFAEAGHPDPLVLRAVHENLMDMPDEFNYGEDAVKWMKGHVHAEAVNRVVPEGAWWL